MNKELKEALYAIEKEKGVDREVILDAIKTALENAYKNYMIRDAKSKGDTFFANMITNDPDYITVVIDNESYDYEIYLCKEVIPDDWDIVSPLTEVKLEEARKYDAECQPEDRVYIEAPHIDLGHIAIQNSTGLIIQKLRELEKKSLFNEFKNKEGTVVTGTVSRRLKNATNINLDKCDAYMPDQESVKGERFKFNDKIKVYVQEVAESARGPKIRVSRADVNLVKKLFENEVLEIQDGTVVIKSISREPGSRSKMAVYSNNPNVDAVGSCLGVNSIRVNAVVDELKGEKIDIINWDEDPKIYVENALSPAKTILVNVDEEDENKMTVIVPDLQLSLAIGKEGQNARLAAKLTGYKIDIKSETEAVEQGLYDKYGIAYDHTKFKKKKDENEDKDENVNNEENLEDVGVEEIKKVEDVEPGSEVSE